MLQHGIEHWIVAEACCLYPLSKRSHALEWAIRKICPVCISSFKGLEQSWQVRVLIQRFQRAVDALHPLTVWESGWSPIWNYRP